MIQTSGMVAWQDYMLALQMRNAGGNHGPVVSYPIQLALFAVHVSV